MTYTITGQWPGGFQGEVVVANTATSAINGWALEWSFPAGQQISQLWGGGYGQQGANVTVENAPWNGTIPAGGQVSFGFIASWQGSNPEPSGFTLNGAACTVT